MARKKHPSGGLRKIRKGSEDDSAPPQSSASSSETKSSEQSEDSDNSSSSMMLSTSPKKQERRDLLERSRRTGRKRSSKPSSLSNGKNRTMKGRDKKAVPFWYSVFIIMGAGAIVGIVLFSVFFIFSEAGAGEDSGISTIGWCQRMAGIVGGAAINGGKSFFELTASSDPSSAAAKSRAAVGFEVELLMSVAEVVVDLCEQRGQDKPMMEALEAHWKSADSDERKLPVGSGSSKLLAHNLLDGAAFPLVQAEVKSTVNNDYHLYELTADNVRPRGPTNKRYALSAFCWNSAPRRGRNLSAICGIACGGDVWPMTVWRMLRRCQRLQRSI